MGLELLTELAKIIEDVKSWGFEPRIIGNCKGFMDYHQTPSGVEKFISPNQNKFIMCGAADGSKH